MFPFFKGPGMWPLWNWQFTQPLLFDDCLTILQKILLLSKKLNDLITDFNKHMKDIESWKTLIENTLNELAESISNLNNRMTTLEECCNSVKNRLSNIETWKNLVDNDLSTIKSTLSTLSTNVTTMQETVSTHTTQLSTLTNTIDSLSNTVAHMQGYIDNIDSNLNNLILSVDSLWDILNSLDIQAPVTVINETNWSAVKTAWFDWLSDFCDTAANHTSGTFAQYWQTTDYITPSINTGPRPTVELSLAKLGQNITVCKLPFILTHALVQPTTIANLQNVMNEIDNLVTASGLSQFFERGITQDNPNFTYSVINVYPANIDVSKFQTSYINYMYGAAPATQINKMFHMEFNADGTRSITMANSINMDVRARVIKDSTTAELQIASNGLYFAVYNGYVNVYFLAENA